METTPKLNGCIQSPHDSRDFQHNTKLRYRIPILRSFILPTSTNNRRACTAIEDQGAIGSCVGNAIAGEFEQYTKRKTGSKIDYSRLYVYYYARLMQGWQDRDSGCYIRDGFKVLKDRGIPKEAMWAYDSSKFAAQPPLQATFEAANRKIKGYCFVQPDDILGIQSILATGQILVFGALVGNDYMNVGRDGIVQTPTKQTPDMGGHAQCIVDYDKTKRYFTIRNSWGTNWGDKGYAYWPFSMFEKQRGLVFEVGYPIH